MSRVAYNRPISQVGFRPMRRTTPFHAAHMSGLGDGAGIPDGSLITYAGTWTTSTQDSDPQDILRKVTSNLPGLKVLNANMQVGAGGYAGAAFEVATDFQVTLQLQVNNGMGFAQPGDIASIVDHYVYMATGNMPTSGATVSALPGAYDPSNVAAAAPGGSLTTWLENNAMYLLLGIGAIVVLPSIVRKF